MVELDEEEHPMVRILDFGVAKLLHAELQTVEIPLQPQIVRQGLATSADLLSQLEGIAVQVTQEPLKILQLLGVGNGLGFGHGFD